MNTPLKSADLQRYIERNGIRAAILRLDEHTATVEDAARVLKVATDQIIKSLVFVADGLPLLVINNGLARVDRRKLAAALDMSRRRVKFATAEQALEITGFVVGSMPPFGHRRKLRTLLDPAVTRQDTIFGGGGDLDAMMELTAAELLRATAAETVAIS